MLAMTMNLTNRRSRGIKELNFGQVHVLEPISLAARVKSLCAVSGDSGPGVKSQEFDRMRYGD
jgi:hypothetical protein